MVEKVGLHLEKSLVRRGLLAPRNSALGIPDKAALGSRNMKRNIKVRRRKVEIEMWTFYHQSRNIKRSKERGSLNVKVILSEQKHEKGREGK